MKIRVILSIVSLALFAVVGPPPGHANETYPLRPITMIVPLAAGGPTDVLARVLAERMSASLGQNVIVENVTGASGTIAVGRVARAAPDGYTVILGNSSTHVITGATHTLSYDLLKDFAPVAMVGDTPTLIVSSNAVPVINLKTLIAWIAANQKQVSAGTSGVGTISHISGIAFQKLTGTQFLFVPYRGLGPAMQSLRAGEIDLLFDQPSNSLPQVRAGAIRAYAVAANRRLRAAPEIPTVDEAGLPGFHVSAFYAVWTSAGTPKDIIAKLNAAITDALADPKLHSRISALGFEIPPPEQQTPEALGALHKAEIEKWWPIIKAAGIKVD